MILWVVLLFIFFHMTLIWCWYRITDNPSVIDVGWASGLTLSGLIYLSHSSLSIRTFILGLALLAWGIRLGSYLWWTRIRKKQIDKRYTVLSQDWKIKKRLGFFLHFQLQGIFVFMVSISWYFTAENPASRMNLLEGIGLILFIIAFVLESTADLELQRFKKINPGKVCQEKLWQFSRHPNCFFDWLIWCSFAFFSVSSPHGFLSIISPLTLYIIMVFMTIPITERESIKSKGEDYIKYQLTTPQFFPRIKGDIWTKVL